MYRHLGILCIERNSTLKHSPIFFDADSMRFLFTSVSVLIIVTICTIPIHIIVAIILSVIVLCVIEGLWRLFGRCFDLYIILITVGLGWC